MKPLLLQLRDEIYICYASFASKDSIHFAEQVRAADTEDVLSNFAARVVTETPGALRRLRDTTASHIEYLADEADKAETGLAKLRDARDALDDSSFQRESLFRLTSELLRQHLPESQLGAKALEFAYGVPVPTDDQEKAEYHSEAAQRIHHNEAVAVAQMLFQDYQTEDSKILHDLSESLGPEIFIEPERRMFRPPDFIPIRYFSHLDLYEQARGLSIGQNLTKSVHFKWLRRLIKPFQRVSNVKIEHLTAIAGYESWAKRNRAQLRRELAADAAEHYRRIHWSAITQVESYHSHVRFLLAARSRKYFREANRSINERLHDLSRERRKTTTYVVTAERLLLQADHAARRILSITTHVETMGYNNPQREGASNGLSSHA